MSERTPFNAKCGNASCGFVWTVCYLPMPMQQAAELMKVACCPMCASRNDRGDPTPVYLAVGVTAT